MSPDVYGVVFVSPSERYHTPWSDVRSPTRELKLGYIVEGRQHHFMRENSPLISKAFSDALSTTGGMERVVEMRLSIISREQWRIRTSAPNLRVLWLTGPVEKGASFVFLSVALQGLFGYSSFRLNYANAPCTVRQLHHPRLGNAPRRASIASRVLTPTTSETGHCAVSEDTLLKCARHRLLSASWLLSSAPNMSHTPSLRSVFYLNPRL